MNKLLPPWAAVVAVLVCCNSGAPAPAQATDFSAPRGHCAALDAYDCVDLYGDENANRDECARSQGTWVRGNPCEKTDRTLGTCALTEDPIGGGDAVPWKRIYWSDHADSDVARAASVESARKTCQTLKAKGKKIPSRQWTDGPAAASRARGAPNK